MTKRILHVVPTTSVGGTSSYILNIMKKLQDKDYIFDFIAFNRGDQEEHFRSLNGRIYYAEYIKNRGFFGSLVFIKKILNENKYDAIHSHQGYKSFISLLAAKLSGINIRICHTHAIEVENPKHKKLLKVFLFFCKVLATRLVACSDHAGKAMFGKSAYTILPNSLDLDSFYKNSEFECEQQQNNEIVLGHVGRFTPVKNHEFIIKLASVLKSRELNFKLLLIGDGPLKPLIEKEVEKLELSNNIIFKGIKSDIFKEMRKMDIFIFPSHFESFSIVLLEAQASGIMSLASSNIPNEVDLNLNRIKFFDIDNIDQWVDFILNYKKDQPVDLEIIREIIVSKGFDAESSAKNLVRLYES